MATSLLRRWLARLSGASAAPAQLPLDGRPWELPASGAGSSEAARWAYRTLLLREPDSRAALEHLARSASARAMRDAVLSSAEARAQPGFPSFPSMSGDEPRLEIEVQVTPGQEHALFERVQAVWRVLGEEKPHWSVVTAEEYRPENIGASLDQFYATGERNVETLLRTLARNGVDPAALRSCMDFGCGVGRLSAALARRFERVVAVDVSPSHVALAREAFARRGLGNVSTHLLERIDDVAQLPACDLVFSLIVLQHNPPPVMRALFVALLGRIARRGVGVIQVPTYLPRYRFDVNEYLERGGREMEMHPLPQAECFSAARAAGIDVLEVLDDSWTGFGLGSRSNTFVMRRA